MKHICNSIKMLLKKSQRTHSCFLYEVSWYVSSGFSRVSMIYTSWGFGPGCLFFFKRSFLRLPPYMLRYSACKKTMVKCTRTAKHEKSTCGSWPGNIFKDHTCTHWWHQLPETDHGNLFVSPWKVKGTWATTGGSSQLKHSPSPITNGARQRQAMFLKEVSHTWKLSL